MCIFLIIWELAYQGMVLKRNLMIMFESARTGISTTQIINVQNASSGMWAFSEGLEVMYLVVLLYLLWPSVSTSSGISRRLWQHPRCAERYVYDAHSRVQHRSLGIRPSCFLRNRGSRGEIGPPPVATITSEAKPKTKGSSYSRTA